MQVTTLRLTATDPTDRGLEYGLAARAEIQQAVACYQTHFRSLGLSAATLADAGIAAVDALRAWRPAAASELEAIAGGAEVGVAELGTLTARTEVLALTSRAPDECSAMAATPADGPAWSLQTWDWNPALAPAGLLVEFPAEAGMLRTFAEPGMPAKIGVNDRGLGLQFNILHHSSDGGRIGVGVHSVARAVLAEASTLAEAEQIAASAPVSASSVFTIVSIAADQPEVACLEITPDGVARIDPTDGFVAHTNHLLDARLATGERSPSTTSGDRLEHLTRQRADLLESRTFADRARAACGEVGADAPICVRVDPAAAPPDQSATLLTIGTDPAAGALAWSVGPPSALGSTPSGRFEASSNPG